MPPLPPLAQRRPPSLLGRDPRARHPEAVPQRVHVRQDRVHTAVAAAVVSAEGVTLNDRLEEQMSNAIHCDVQ